MLPYFLYVNQSQLVLKFLIFSITIIYNDEGEWLCISLHTWIYACLQTNKWVRLPVCLQKVSRCGSQKAIMHYYMYTSSNSLIISHVIQSGSDPDKFWSRSDLTRTKCDPVDLDDLNYKTQLKCYPAESSGRLKVIQYRVQLG